MTMDLAAIPLSFHQHAMRAAIAAAAANPERPFGAVIVRPPATETLATGVNAFRVNPTLHAEMAAIHDYVARHGNAGWDGLVIYATGEPCPMCISALAWARIGGVVFATSTDRLGEFGMDRIPIRSADIAAAVPFHRIALLGGILAHETDPMFANRAR